MEGTVKWFNARKGFGFIVGEDNEDYFVHSSAIAQGTFLRDNDRVAFEPAEGERGKQAQNVTLIQKGSERNQKAPAEKAEEESDEEDQE